LVFGLIYLGVLLGVGIPWLGTYLS
jgi:hypothetical protein